MNLVDQIKANLKDYYEKEGIEPNRFACRNIEQCKGDYARGMQCYLGSEYGKKTKILVASLDCGNGGHNDMETQTVNVLADAANGGNDRHMKGTYGALSLFYGADMPSSQIVRYIAMTNTCKCCRQAYAKNPSNHMPYSFFWNCREHTVNEILLLRPDIILFQGKLAPIGCQEMMTPVDDSTLKDYLFVLRYKGLTCYAVKCIHPSARGRSASKRKTFYKDTLPIIVDYIKKHRLAV